MGFSRRQIDVTQDMVDDLKAKIEQGMTQKQAGKLHGITAGFVSRVLKEPDYFINREAFKGTSHAVGKALMSRNDAADSGRACVACGIYFNHPYGERVICDVCLKHSQMSGTHYEYEDVVKVRGLI